MLLLISAFSAFFTVQLIKILVTPKLQGQGVWKVTVKLLLVGAVSVGTALLAAPGGHWRASVAYGLAGAGLAIAIHKVVQLVHWVGSDANLKFFLRGTAPVDKGRR